MGVDGQKDGEEPLARLKRRVLKPIEENGFVIADLTPDKIVLHYFRWNAHRDSLAAIDTLEPFRSTELKRPG